MSVVQRFSCDDETGEISTYFVNEETGEPCSDDGVPPLYIPRLSEARTRSTRYLLKLPRGCGYDGKKFQRLRENIIAGTNQISYRMLLIPTMMICPGVLCVLLLLLEIYLHVRCHKKNKSLKEAAVYYRSPFHVVTSTFCGSCRESDSAWKVGKLQDQRRRNHYDYLL